MNHEVLTALSPWAGVNVDGVTGLSPRLGDLNGKTVGLLAPVVAQLGYDLVWFGIIVAFTVAVGALTPPVGINLFVVSSRAPEIPIATIIKGMVPYLITICLTLIIIFYVPQISLLLPNLMFGS